MVITIFDNKKGIVRGRDTNRVISEQGGVLQIGNSRVEILQKESTELPVLCDGQSGEFPAKFTSVTGDTYELATVELIDGRIVQPSSEYDELGVLYNRAKSLDNQISELKETLSKYNIQKQETINALNNNPLKYLIE